MKKKCPDCKKLCDVRATRCKSCANTGSHNPMFGVKSPNFEDGRSLKQYYCQDCHKEISYQSALYGFSRCQTCSNIFNAHWTGQNCKEIIINHHIYLKEYSNQTMKMTSSEHIRLHMNGYKYLVYLGLVQDYLKEFLLKYQDALTTQNVRHHIDCDRRNNKLDNFLYVASKGIHTQLHHEAYEYLVKIGMVEKYISWFFLMEKKNTHREKSKGGTIYD